MRYLDHPFQAGLAHATPLLRGEDRMQVSRRDFVRLTASAGAGTAIGGMVGVGGRPAPAAARGQELPVQDGKTTPSNLPFRSGGCAPLIQHGNATRCTID